ncbi:MAG TPA: FAD-dependent oxidoreductase [Frankiaceae bacterium]|nr:FAD-dependent oxidoreductase [Frankiaceae bacterium]
MEAPAKFDRRGFLGLIGVGALAACSSAGSGSAPSSPTIPPSSTPPPPSSAGPPNWAALGNKLSGTLVLPDDPAYAVSRQLYDFRYDSIRPQAIAYCESISDVQNCLEVARSSGVTPRPRAGGHSYGGWSTGDGLVIDVTRMAGVNTSNAAATIGSGARLVDVYAGLAAAGVAIPAGSCPTVGISGLTLGGGQGVVGRSFGLTCDRLQSVDVITADGTLRHCTKGSSGLDGDLFWASQGGGGGNFGIATSFTFSTVAAPTLVSFGLSWPWSAAADVISGWLSWAPGAPDEIWSTLLLIAHPGGTGAAGPQIRINGVYNGSLSTSNSLVNGLINAVGSQPSGNSSFTQPDYLSAMLYEGGCSGLTVEQCHLPTQTAGGQLTRKPGLGASDYVTSPLSAAGIGVIIDFVNQRQADPSMGEGGAQFDAYGGAINRVASNATAFPHRNALAGIQRSSSFSMTDSPAVIAAGQTWLDAFTKALRPYVSGGSYVNYQDPDLANFAEAYYGSNLTRLQGIKQQADPEKLFTFPQVV